LEKKAFKGYVENGKDDDEGGEGFEKVLKK
jgi:hypothetical protein